MLKEDRIRSQAIVERIGIWMLGRLPIVDSPYLGAEDCCGVSDHNAAEFAAKGDKASAIDLKG